MRLEGVGALVTGAASGLGRASALALAEAGAEVVAADLPRALEKADLPATIGRVATDVTDFEAVKAAAATATERAPLRIAVSCAGVGLPGRMLPRGREANLEAMHREVQVNLLGTMHLLLAAGRTISEQEPVGEERGLIVTTASAAAFEGQIGQLGYSASKGGVAAITLPAARELAGHAIRVVSIAPGLFDTPMLGTLPDEVRQDLAASVPHPARLGRPEEFAEVVVDVAEAPLLNGVVIRLDGALRMAPS